MRSRSLHGFSRGAGALAGAAVVFVLLTVSVPGCGKPKSDGTTDKSGAKVDGKNDGKAAAKLVFLSNNNAPFWVFAQRGVEKASKDLGGNFDFKMPQKGSAEEQKEVIEDMRVKGVQGIAISPNNARNMGDFLGSVNKEVPVLVVDSDVPDPSTRRAYLGTNNYLAGRALGELVAKGVPEGGKLVFFVGRMDAINAQERRQGVIDYLKGEDRKEMGKMTPANAAEVPCGKFTMMTTITDGERQAVECQEKAEDYLSKTPDVAVLVGLWEYNPPALLRAVKKLESKAKIAAFDENDQTLVAIQDGKMIGTVVQSPYEFGYQSMKILNALATGDANALKNYPGIDAQNRIYIPHRVITQENVGEFREKCKELLGKK